MFVDHDQNILVTAVYILAYVTQTILNILRVEEFRMKNLRKRPRTDNSYVKNLTSASLK